MIPWTTPTHTIRIHGIDLTGCRVFVDYRQGCWELHKEAEYVAFEDGVTTIRVTLSQRESGSFKPDSKVSMQVNWLYADGSRDATIVREFDNLRNLYEKVL